MTTLRLILQIFHDFFHSMATYAQRLIELTGLFDRYQAEIVALRSELGSTKMALAQALANDKADAETIATAQADAEQAIVRANQAEEALGVARQTIQENIEDGEKLDALIAQEKAFFDPPIVDPAPAEPEPAPVDSVVTDPIEQL